MWLCKIVSYTKFPPSTMIGCRNRASWLVAKMTYHFFSYFLPVNLSITHNTNLSWMIVHTKMHNFVLNHQDKWSINQHDAFWCYIWFRSFVIQVDMGNFCVETMVRKVRTHDYAMVTLLWDVVLSLLSSTIVLVWSHLLVLSESIIVWHVLSIVLAALGSVKAATFMARFFVMIVEEMVLLLKVLYM